MPLPPALTGLYGPTDPRQSYARILLNNAGDTSPIQSPWQGVARVGQGLVGGYLANQSIEEAKAKEAAKAKAYGDILAGGQAKPWVDPGSVVPGQEVAPGRVSDAPAGGMAGMQAAMQGAPSEVQQAMVPLLLGEQFKREDSKAALEDELKKPYTLGPGQQRFGANGQTIASVPAKPELPPTVTTAEGVFIRNSDGSLGARLGAAPSMIAANQPPSGYEQNPGGPGLRPIEGGPADPAVIEKTAQARKLVETKPIPANINTAISENLQAIRKIDQALAALNPANEGGDPAATGWKGFIGDDLLNRLDPKGTKARALIADIGSLKMHDRSGAAVSASESPRLRPFIPSIRDNAETVRDKLANFRNEYANALNDFAAVYNADQGYKENPVLSGFVNSGTLADVTKSTGGGAPSLSPEDTQALEWATANPNDPRAAAIRQRLGR